MSVIAAVNKIDALSLQYAPQVLASVSAVEAAASSIPGITKEQIVINTVLAGAQVASSLPIPSVSGIAGLVALFVGILNANGVFSHKATAQPPTPPSESATAETVHSA